MKEEILAKGELYESDIIGDNYFPFNIYYIEDDDYEVRVYSRNSFASGYRDSIKDLVGKKVKIMIKEIK